MPVREVSVEFIEVVEDGGEVAVDARVGGLGLEGGEGGGELSEG